MLRRQMQAPSSCSFLFPQARKGSSHWTESYAEFATRVLFVFPWDLEWLVYTGSIFVSDLTYGGFVLLNFWLSQQWFRHVRALGIEGFSVPSFIEVI